MALFGKNNAAPSKPESGATQQFVDVKEIREGIVIMKDGSLRALIEVSSINFALKGTDEQAAIILQFQEFLNSLDFSIQITINSRKLDINPYLNFLEQLAVGQTNELLKVQTEEYLNFIRGMVEMQNIMSKKFYLIVPLFRPMASVASAIPGRSAALRQENSEEYFKSKNQLLQRVDHVIIGIRRLGLKTRLIDSEEILGLLVQLYNPTAQLKDLNLPTNGLVNYS